MPVQWLCVSPPACGDILCSLLFGGQLLFAVVLSDFALKPCAGLWWEESVFYLELYYTWTELNYYTTSLEQAPGNWG